MKYCFYKYLIIMIGIILHFYPYKEIPELYFECTKIDTITLFSKSYIRLHRENKNKIYFGMNEKFKVDTIKK